MVVHFSNDFWKTGPSAEVIGTCRSAQFGGGSGLLFPFDWSVEHIILILGSAGKGKREM